MIATTNCDKKYVMPYAITSWIIVVINHLLFVQHFCDNFQTFISFDQRCYM